MRGGWPISSANSPLRDSNWTGRDRCGRCEGVILSSVELAALLHSISYGGLWGQAALTVDETVDKAADLGFDGVLLAAKRPHLSVLDYGVKERAELRRR